ncbi:MAG: hypothetical protein ACYCYP_12410 [Leptospirales bacterium]
MTPVQKFAGQKVDFITLIHANLSLEHLHDNAGILDKGTKEPEFESVPTPIPAALPIGKMG